MRTTQLKTLLWTLKVDRERPLLQPFVEQPEAVPIPEKQFDAVARPVEEDEEVAGERVALEVIAYDTAEAVVRLPEVHRFATDVDADRAGQGQHPESASITRRR